MMARDGCKIGRHHRVEFEPTDRQAPESGRTRQEPVEVGAGDSPSWVGGPHTSCRIRSTPGLECVNLLKEVTEPRHGLGVH